MNFLKSSTGSGNLSLTVKGLILSLVPITITILQSQGVAITESDVVEIVNNVFAVVSLCWVIYGGLRKLWNAWQASR